MVTTPPRVRWKRQMASGGAGSYELPDDFFSRSEEERWLVVHAWGRPAPDPRSSAFRLALAGPFNARDPRAVPGLMRVAEEDPSIKVRRAALMGLQRSEDRRTIPVLLNALRSEDPASREHAILGLETLNAREGVPGLISILDDPRQRTLAARALVTIRDERGLEPIRAASKRGWPRSRRVLRALAAELATAVGR